MTDLMRDFATRLLDVTEGCRPDLHEPDEQDLKARVVGDHLDNAYGETVMERMIVEGYQEFVVILKRFHAGTGRHQTECFNLATLIALARIGARRLTAGEESL